MLSQDDIEKLKTQHLRIAHVVGKDNVWECVFRKPTRSEYKRFRAMAVNDAQKPEAQEWLAVQCVVYPTREGFDDLLNDYPAIPEGAAGELIALTGMAVNESSKT